MRVVCIAVALFLFGWGNKALAEIDPVGFVRSALVRGERNVIVPKGVYRVRPDGVDPRVYFRLAGLSDVTVDFSGSDLVGLVRTRFFDLSGCTNVTIRNVSFDFDELPFTQAVIERVDAGQNWDVRVIDGYPCPGAVKGRIGLDSHDDFWPIQAYDGKTFELKNPMRYQDGISIERTGERTYRIVGGLDRRGDVGDIAVWSVQEDRLPTLSENVNVFRCRDVVFENVTQYATPHGRAFIDWESANTTYRNCRVVRRPPETDPVKRGLKRLRSGNHDAFISKNAYVGPKLIGCEAEYHCDDSVNISGAYQVVYSCHGDEVRVFVHGTWDLQLDAGDSCQVLTPGGQTPPNVWVLAVLPGASVTAEESRYLASIGLWPGIAQGMRKSYVLKLDRDADFPRGTLLASEGRMGNGFLIRDCRFGSTRGRGLLLKASDGCVENCRVMKPVCLTTEYEWLSAGIARNVVFRGNIFESGMVKGGTAAKGIRLPGDVNTGIVVEQGEEPARFVNPFIGTAGTGHTFPGACVPFGMVQASPDCGTESWSYCSGYRHEDDSVFGFSQTHLNGTGGEDLGDVLLLPFCGNAEARGWKERIDKKTETASPGYYAVTLTDSAIRAEVTATEHVALYRFRYDGEGPARLLYDGQWGIVHEGWMADYMKSFSFVQDGDRGFSGQRQTKSWNLREIGFNVVFDRPCTSCTKLPRVKSGDKGARYVFEFDLKPGETLLVKVGLAAGGAQERGALPERAKANLSAEIPGWDFDGAREAARQKWNEILGRAVVEGTEDQKKNWYTSLYRLCIQPNNMADVGSKPFYSTFSCWDTFRAAGPLYTILCPEKASAFVDSMLEQGRRTGYLPIWTLWGTDNQCMIGTHSVPMIVDWFLKEVGEKSSSSRKEEKIHSPTPTLNSNSYWLAAYAQIKDTLTKPHKARHKERWDLLDQYGYYPFDKIRGESVSRTMECAYDDWCAGVMAQKLGERGTGNGERDNRLKADAEFFFKRSENWRNVFDASIGLVRGKDTKGSWREPFDPYALGHGADLDNDFTEGNAFQYSWHVMQDVQGLVDMMGGRESFAKKMDALFEAPPKTEGTGCHVDITGLIGQYVHGNEPSHHVIYFYPQIGQPEKAAERIREVFDKFYQPKPDGLCGNDDCGQMSAWYLFSAMGFYPFNPCGGEYIIGAPQVPEARIRLRERGTGNGEREFKVIAKNLSRENKYVKSVTLNGKPITDWRIRHADIMAGGELVFAMCSDAPE